MASSVSSDWLGIAFKSMNKKYYKNKDWHSSEDYKHRLAVKGEDIAAAYVTRHFDMRIVGRNVRCRFGELDIVAVDHGVLCFIEVKSRRNTEYGYPAEAVNYEKQKRIRKLAQYYILGHCQYREFDIRFDVAQLIITDKSQYINYIKNAF